MQMMTSIGHALSTGVYKNHQNKAFSQFSSVFNSFGTGISTHSISRCNDGIKRSVEAIYFCTCTSKFKNIFKLNLLPDKDHDYCNIFTQLPKLDFDGY